MSSSNEVDVLRQELDQLRNQVRQLRSEPSAPSPVPVNEPGDDAGLIAPTSINRRSLLGKAGVVAGAAAVSVALGSKTAAADPGDLTTGAVNNTAARTELRYTSNTDTSTNLFTVQDGSYSTGSRRAAVGGWAVGDAIYNGVYGYSEGRLLSDPETGHGVVAYGGSNSRSSIYMVPFGGDPRTEAVNHARGSMRMTSSALWLCTTGGTSSQWRRLAGFNTAGAYQVLTTPRRAYDSRTIDGPMSVGQTRTVSVLVPGMPSRPTAVTGTIVAVTPDATGLSSGWFTVWEGQASLPNIATVNYNQDQVVTSSAFTSAVNSNGTIAVNCGNLGADVVIDITGAYA